MTQPFNALNVCTTELTHKEPATNQTLDIKEVLSKHDRMGYFRSHCTVQTIPPKQKIFRSLSHQEVKPDPKTVFFVCDMNATENELGIVKIDC